MPLPRLSTFAGLAAWIPMSCVRQWKVAPRSFTWPKAAVLPDRATFLFHDFFDFDTVSLIDLAYCELRLGGPSDPSVGE